MTPQEAISYIEDYGWSSSRLGLDRTRLLLERLGDPQKQLKFIHVAGSNGKGSTCAMLASVLREAGYRTGLYTSPYIQTFYERMQVNGENIPGALLAELTAQVQPVADAMEDHPSQFELVTAIAMLYFKHMNCDIVVLEVGLGGRLDSTNIIDPPEVSVITNIGLEHTEFLGDTLEKIAAEKAAIIKPGCAAVCYDNVSAVVDVVRSVCAAADVPLTLVDFSGLSSLEHDLHGQNFLWQEQAYHIPLLGPHQLCNAAVVLSTVDALRARGWGVSDDAVRQGLAAVCWPARFEILSHEPLFILDGGHNPQCAQALADILKSYLPGQKVTFLTGVLADKDYRSMLESVLPFAAEFICITPDNPRALEADALAGLIRQEYGLPAAVCDHIDDALTASLETGRTVVAFGYLYTAGAIRTEFFPALKRLQRKQCLSARRALSPQERVQRSQAICRALMELPAIQQAKTVLSYQATWDEADLSAFHTWAVKQGISVAFPVSKANGIMDAFIPQDDQSWETGAYGIPSPIPARSQYVDPSEIDIVLIPCVGFDKTGGRLGHGAGYYDRYLPRCPQAKQIAIAFDAQELPSVAQTEQDVPMQFVVTDRGVLGEPHIVMPL